jgi:hypothetical protein
VLLSVLLTGSIPAAIGLLTSLTLLCVHFVRKRPFLTLLLRGMFGNQVIGSLPSELGRLSALREL